MNPNPKNFCIGVFSEIRIEADGKILFCHAADKDHLPNSDNINNLITVDDYFNNGGTVNLFRNSNLNGEYLSPCHNCYATEEKNLLSFRQRRNNQAAIFYGEDFLPSFDEAYEKFKNFKHPRFYHISLSNLCNMGCIMCDADGSNLLAKNLYDSGLLTGSRKLTQDWTKDSEIWNKFCQHLLNNNEIISFHFMGGEPLYHKKFYELIDFFIKHNHTDFHLTFVTNGSKYSPDLIKKLKKFKSVQIEISIETLSKSNDYIRYPSNTSKIVKNIQNFLSHRDNNIDVVLRTVPQLMSIFDYSSILKFARENSVVIDSNFLFEPSFLQPCVLYNEQKSTVLRNLNSFVIDNHRNKKTFNFRDNNNINEKISENAERVIAAIQEPCDNIELKRREMVEYCAKIDKTRNIDIREYIPELKQLFNDYDYEEARYNNKFKFKIYKTDNKPNSNNSSRQ